MSKKLLKSLVASWRDIEDDGTSTYPGSKENHGHTANFARHFGLDRLGVGHDRLRPGERTSWPHAEESEDEFIFVIEGTPDVWIDGYMRRLAPGDGVGFRSGTGVSHTFINNTDKDVRLLVVGEPSRRRSRIAYPLHTVRKKQLGERYWHDAPKKKLGPHNGEPDKPRHKHKSTRS
jgi:uncharacterized cupin superfamily protein